jgi:hypothetical protein
MRSALLYILGVPIPLIILIALFTGHCCPGGRGHAQTQQINW